MIVVYRRQNPVFEKDYLLAFLKNNICKQPVRINQTYCHADVDRGVFLSKHSKQVYLFL